MCSAEKVFQLFKRSAILYILLDTILLVGIVSSFSSKENFVGKSRGTSPHISQMVPTDGTQCEPVDTDYGT